MENNTGLVKKLLMTQLTMKSFMIVLYKFLVLSINTGRIQSLSLAETAVSNPTGSMDVSLMCCQVEVSASG